jgi:hypothetical protein
MDQQTNPIQKLSPNRIVCEKCGRQVNAAFTDATPDGKLDLRNLCADCRGLQPLSILETQRLRHRRSPPH